jgi:type IV pilus assembly protein PilW
MRVGHRGSGVDRGFTLIELMIALLIGVFLLGALLTIVQANRTVFGDQNKMAQLQDAERMSMAMLSDVIQSGGYFPAPYPPSNNTLTGSLISAAPFAAGAAAFAAGQAFDGVYSAAAPGDQLAVRYMTASGDGILNCSGLPNTSGANVLYTNIFQVVQDASGNWQLTCTMNGTQYNLVSGVTNMSVLYGVKANAGATGNSVDTYMNASQVTAAGLWSSVISVMVQLTFTNPMYYAGNSAQPQTMVVQRVVSVMEQSGPVQ